VGSIDVGKDADLVIYNHDPLSAYAVVQRTLVDGRVLFDRDRDIAGRATLEKEKKDLLEKEKKAEKITDQKKPEEKKPEPAKKPDDKAKPPSDAVKRDSGEEMITSPNGGAL
jgi:adenine deaminase